MASSLLDEKFKERDAAQEQAAPPPAELSRGAFRAAQLQQRAEQAAQRAVAAEQRAGLAERGMENANARTSLAQETAALDAKLKEAKEARTRQVVEQGKGFMNDAIGMNPASPDFDIQLQKMLAGYPDAAEHPGVKQWLDYHTDIRKKHVDAGIVPDLKRIEDEAAARARGTASAKPANAPEDNAKRLGHLESLRMKKIEDPDVKAYLDAEITKLKTPAVAAPVRTATNPATGEKMAFRDGKWQPL